MAGQISWAGQAVDPCMLQRGRMGLEGVRIFRNRLSGILVREASKPFHAVWPLPLCPNDGLVMPPRIPQDSSCTHRPPNSPRSSCS